MIDVCSLECLVSAVFEQQRPFKTIFIAAAGVLEIGSVSAVRGIIKAKGPLSRDIIRIIVGSVLVEVQEDLTESTSIGCCRETDSPDDFI